MPTITLKRVPASLHARLKAQAKAHKRSLTQEALHCIEAATLPRPRDPGEMLERIRRSRERLRAAGVPELDEAFLEAARNDGRA